jgi:soluble lytic murein transglycosylase-like protein
MAMAQILIAGRWLGAAGAGSLAVLAGVALAQRSALETTSRMVVVPALRALGGESEAPGRSRAPAPVAVAASEARSDAAPPPRSGARAGFPARAAEAAPSAPARRPSAATLRARERRVTIARLAAVLDRFATGLDRASEKVLAAAIHDESRRWGLDPFLVLAVIQTESTFRNEAISFMGARGLMQIRPFVGEELAARLRLDWRGEATLHDPVANVTMGIYYLAHLRARFGDLTLALAGYNIGPNAVQALLDEEREVPAGYVRKVLAAYGRLLGASHPPRTSVVAARSGRPAQ